MSPLRKPQNSFLLVCNLLKINVHIVKFIYYQLASREYYPNSFYNIFHTN